MAGGRYVLGGNERAVWIQIWRGRIVGAAWGRVLGDVR